MCFVYVHEKEYRLAVKKLAESLHNIHDVMASKLLSKNHKPRCQISVVILAEIIDHKAVLKYKHHELGNAAGIG